MNKPKSQSVWTELTPDTNAQATFVGDENNTVNVGFYYQRITPYWTPSVSSANKSATLADSAGNSTVTFEKGLKVNFLSTDKTVQITVSGNIKDNGTAYPISGENIGTFSLKS